MAWLSASNHSGMVICWCEVVLILMHNIPLIRRPLPRARAFCLTCSADRQLAGASKSGVSNATWQMRGYHRIGLLSWPLYTAEAHVCTLPDYTS